MLVGGMVAEKAEDRGGWRKAKARRKETAVGAAFGVGRKRIRWTC